MIMRILVIKLSSFGDIIHTLPAITDAARSVNDLEIDWLVDESFANMPSWHPNVNNVIRCAHRRWRKTICKAFFSGEIRLFLQQLRHQRYDVIIDAQSSIKTAVLAWVAHGPVCGYNRASVREKGAEIAYQRTFFIANEQHATTRIRQLFAKALDYKLPTSLPDANITLQTPTKEPELPSNYVVFIPFTTWQTKHWPMVYWQTLIQEATENGLTVSIYFAGEREYKKAKALQGDNPRVILLPDLSLNQRLIFFQRAQAFVGVDTGPSHLAASLKVPGITLFGPTDPALVGPMGKNQTHLAVNYPCAKCKKRTCDIVDNTIAPGCYVSLTPDMVWQKLSKITKKSATKDAKKSTATIK